MTEAELISQMIDEAEDCGEACKELATGALIDRLRMASRFFKQAAGALEMHKLLNGGTEPVDHDPEFEEDEDE